MDTGSSRTGDADQRNPRDRRDGIAVDAAASAHRWRAENPLRSFRHASDGVHEAFRTQRNLRVHFLVVALVVAAGLLLRLGRVEILILLLTAALVVVAEMFNTAVEVVVDLITPDYHPAAKAAKDIAAGAVLAAAVNAAVVGCVLFLGDGRPPRAWLREPGPPPAYALLAALLLLPLAVVAWRAARSAARRRGTL